MVRRHYPETALLRQVEGIGPLAALTFVLTLEDPYRFERSHSVGAYLGLVPAMDLSGDRDLQKRISKESDEMLREHFKTVCYGVRAASRKEEISGWCMAHFVLRARPPRPFD